MALGYLSLLFAGMGLLVIVGTVLLFVVKSKHATDIIMVLMTFYSLVIAYLDSTARPSNYISQQVVCWIIGIIAVGGASIRFLKKDASILSKVLVAVSVVGGMAYMFFF